MRYDPKAATLCLQAGEYDAAILSVEEKTSSKGNPMEVVTFEVYPTSGATVKLKEYFVEGQPFAAFKYKRLAQALGKDAEFQAGNFQADACVGEPLTVTLGIKEDDYGEKNVIEGFGPKRLGAKPISTPKPRPVRGPTVPAGTPLTEEDIPF